MSYSNELKKYLLEIPEKKSCCKNVLKAGISKEIPNFICKKDSWVYIRGIFISSGNISDPQKVFRLSLNPGNELIEIVSEILNTSDLRANRMKKRGKIVLYFRNSTKIEDFLAAIGASRYSLNIMEDKIIRDMRINANRISNAEIANINKAVTAANKQQVAIRLLKKHKEFETLPKELRESAELRLEYPDLTLDELRLKLPKPLSKSGMNHRLNRLVEFAEKYKGN